MPEKETGRLEAFSDGVFAIAITLLALELKVPHSETGQITAATVMSGLAHQWPSYFAFITSFFTVLVMWVHHHAMFRLVRRVDVTLLFANGFLLMLGPPPHRRSRRVFTNPRRRGSLHLLRGLLRAHQHWILGFAMGSVPHVSSRSGSQTRNGRALSPQLSPGTTAVSSRNRRRTLQPLASNGNLQRPVDRMGRDYARVLTASLSPICRKQRSIHCFVSFSCTPFCESRVRKLAQST